MPEYIHSHFLFPFLYEHVRMNIEPIYPSTRTSCFHYILHFLFHLILTVEVRYPLEPYTLFLGNKVRSTS